MLDRHQPKDVARNRSWMGNFICSDNFEVGAGYEQRLFDQIVVSRLKISRRHLAAYEFLIANRHNYEALWFFHNS
jgi:hypothetical protein